MSERGAYIRIWLPRFSGFHPEDTSSNNLALVAVGLVFTDSVDSKKQTKTNF